MLFDQILRILRVSDFNAVKYRGGWEKSQYRKNTVGVSVNMSGIADPPERLNKLGGLVNSDTVALDRRLSS